MKFEMNEKIIALQAKANAPKYFLVDHGVFYGKEITNGIVFAFGREDEERKQIQTAVPGDLFFHLSPSGISAIGKAITAAYRAPIPFWRRREGGLGDLGYLIEIETFLLPVCVPFSHSGVPEISALSKEQAEALFTRILKHTPEIVNAEWMQSVCLRKEM